MEKHIEFVSPTLLITYVVRGAWRMVYYKYSVCTSARGYSTLYYEYYEYQKYAFVAYAILYSVCSLFVAFAFARFKIIIFYLTSLVAFRQVTVIVNSSDTTLIRNNRDQKKILMCVIVCYYYFLHGVFFIGVFLFIA